MKDDFRNKGKLWLDELRIQTMRVKGMLELPKMAENLTEIEFMQYGQELAENLTESQISFIHFIHDNEQAIELVTWSRCTIEHYCSAVYDKHYPVSRAGIWAEALHQRKPIIFNDYSSYPHKRGMPAGHSPLIRLISVPVIENNKIVMITGVGNKSTDYNNLDVETVQLFSNAIWRIVQHRRNITKLRNSEAQYKELVDNLSDAVSVYRPIDDGLDFVFHQHNRAAERIFKVISTQIIGRCITAVFPGLVSCGLLNVFRKVLQTGQPQKFGPHLYQDECLKIWIYNYVFKLSSGEIIAVYRDVTRQKQARDALKTSYKIQQILNDLLRITLENKPLTVILNHALSIIVLPLFCNP